MSKVLPVTDIPPRRTSEPSDDSLDDASDNDALITQALNPDGTPRRPMNAFMIFARRRRPEITANNPPLRTGEISKVLSSEWAAMSSESKQFYLDRARKLKDNFNARWPDYVYRRRPNNSRKRKRPDVPSSAHPAIRRTSPGYEPVVPSSKVKYEDGYQHPLLPSLPSTNAPLTMVYVSEAERSMPPYGMISAPYHRGAATPSLASSILTSASASPRSVSGSLPFRYNEPIGMTNSPPNRRPGAWKDAVLSPESSAASSARRTQAISPTGAPARLTTMPLRAIQIATTIGHQRHPMLCATAWLFQPLRLISRFPHLAPMTNSLLARVQTFTHFSQTIRPQAG
ncbi:HMG (high mobility group) box protein [Rhizoctonia solani]|uniref:HMG (High mobility group) box protein n=1 Tax=Rhizoctonia solani TaxID=456999 RepID=A0A8H8P109_9AGAM|nr:HMG (high mobility group) box protein [Rhizoctonia solani]QRW21707.1 HMG (high mobility group) box protein [Rhizoctonia solani]